MVRQILFANRGLGNGGATCVSGGGTHLKCVKEGGIGCGLSLVVDKYTQGFRKPRRAANSLHVSKSHGKEKQKFSSSSNRQTCN